MTVASVPVRCTLNGDSTEFLCRPHHSLLEVLRDQLGFTGSKNGCSDGNCGACSVLIDGRLVNSCLVLAAEVEGRTIVTVEGLAKRGELDVIQQAFIDEDALQCGICTPGMVMSCRALLDRHPDPTEAEIRRWLAGNLCRCTGYETIIRAVKRAALLQAGANGDSMPMAGTSDPSSVEESGIGGSPPRKDGRAKVTGVAVYGADVQQVGALVGLVLRSPHAHARIVSVDTSKAEKLPGVHAVITAGDLPKSEDLMAQLGESFENYKFLCDNTLASEKALYLGHPIAAVAAVSEDVAREALELIKVGYEVLPAVTDVRDAIKKDAPLLHENLLTQGPDGPAETPSNVASHLQQVKGDPDKAFADADVVVERAFRIETVHQGYIEPQSTTAVWDSEGEGSVTVYTTTQGSFDMRGQIVQMLKLPEDRVRVVPTEMGGGFGGKVRATLEIPAILLSRKSGRPVKMTLSRSEVLLGTGPSPAAFVRVKLGSSMKGRLVAAEATLHYEGGGYPGAMIGAGAQSILGPYDIPHVRIDAYDVVVNKPMVAAYRAPCAPQASFAGEQVVDEMALRLEMDPLEFRLKNTAENGTVLANGVVHNGIGCREVLEALRDHPHARSELKGPHTGRGVAVGCWGNWGARSSCRLDVLADGMINLVTGSVDVTGTRTSLAMHVAEVLEIPLDQIRARFGHTDEVGYANTSAGSRTTVATGVAVTKAAHLALDELKRRAAAFWETTPDKVTYAKGRFGRKGEVESLTFAELAAKLPDTGGIVSTIGDVNVEKWGIAFAGHMVDVRVDPETGKVEILRYTAVQDVGRAIHPLQIEGQIRGGVAQGIGWALYEGYDYNADGQMLNASLLDYRMPTAMDVPPIDTVILEIPFPDHPLGTKGVGEAPIIPPLGALANAITQATGQRITHAPMTSRHILEAMGVIESP